MLAEVALVAVLSAAPVGAARVAAWATASLELSVIRKYANAAPAENRIRPTIVPVAARSSREREVRWVVRCRNWAGPAGLRTRCRCPVAACAGRVTWACGFMAGLPLLLHRDRHRDGKGRPLATGG